MKKEKVTDAALAENIKRATKIIKALEANAKKLKEDIAKGHVNNVSIFCAIGNGEADRVDTVITGTSHDMILAIANALDGEPAAQRLMAEALMIVA